MNIVEKQTTRTRMKIGPISEAILVSIASVGVISILVLFPGMTCVIAPLLKKKSFQKRDVQKNLDSLIRAGLVKMHTDAKGNSKIELTKKGKWEAFLRLGFQDFSKKKWDGMWRVVIFDIPISKNKIRKELRRAMILFGFKMLQQSVWTYPYSCDDFVALLKNYLGVKNNVLYMKVGHIENDKYLRKEFGL